MSDEERDLGVIVDQNLCFEAHINAKIAKANSFLGLIRRSFTYLDKRSVTKLYIAFVRRHLEYAQAVWSPSKQALINRLEKVQMRAMNLIPDLKGIPYADQLKACGLPTLAYRRARGDMIEVYKHLNCYDKAVICDTFSLTGRPSRHLHNLQLTRSVSSSALRNQQFYTRAPQMWNILNSDIVQSDNVNTFKNRLDSAWKNEAFKFDHTAPLPTWLNNLEPPIIRRGDGPG